MKRIVLDLEDDELESLIESIDQDNRGTSNLLGGFVDTWPTDGLERLRLKIASAVAEFAP